MSDFFNKKDIAEQHKFKDLENQEAHRGSIENVLNEEALDIEKKEYFRAQQKDIQKAFTNRRLNIHFCDDIVMAQDKMVDLIKKFRRKTGTTKIGFGDSMSLHQINAFEIISEFADIEMINPLERYPDGNYKVFGPLEDSKLDLPQEEYEALVEKLLDLMRDSLMTDIYLASANALTRDGKIVLLDGTGNRVSGVIFGPRKVILVVGRNKFVNDLDTAFDHIYNYVSPLNSIRHINKHHMRLDSLPCVKKGKCYDCSSERRTCNAWGIIEGATVRNGDRIHIIIVNDDLGI